MANIHDVNESLQVQPSVKNLPTLIALSQGENGRSLQFRMVGATIPSGSSASLSGTKPDGVVYSKAGTVDGNTVIFQEDVQLTAVAGAWDAKIHIVNSGDSIATALIRFIIEPDPVAEGAIPSDSQLEGIVAECRAYAEEARSSAYGSPLVASLVADMIDHTRVYVYVGNEDGYTTGNWYYWNGTAWTSGGVYNSAAVQLDTTLTLAGVAAEAKAVGDALKDKADKSGVIDNAKQLLSTIHTTNSEPYNFRAIPEGAGDREYLSVVGGSLGWNQLVADSGSSLSVTVQSGHKYFMNKGGTKSIGTSDGTALTGLTGGTDIVIDLTTLFGSTIADYIYTLEQGTAGAGVAWLRKYCPKLFEYNEYDAGSIQSVEGLVSHDTVGFNQFDESNADFVDRYYIDENGNAASSANYKYSNVYTAIIPNTEYALTLYKDSDLSLSSRIVFYDANKTFLGRSDSMTTSTARGVYTHTFTTINNAKYVRLDLPKDCHNICINLSDPSRNGQYEPYEKHSYSLDSTLTLRGEPKLDSDHKLYFDGDVYTSDGRLRRRYGERAYQSGDESLANAITDGTTAVYKLSTPTTETAQPFTSPQICDAGGTEEFVSDSLIPVGSIAEYPADLRKQIENIYGLPKPPLTDGNYRPIATVSDGVLTFSWVSDS